MKKNVSLVITCLFFVIPNLTMGQYTKSKISVTDHVNVKINQSIHQFIVFDINHIPFDFSKLKGKKIMIVNTASKCGYTPQYEQLQQLYEKYKNNGFVVIGFPANNFRNQEPGSNEEIETFCKLNYGVSFPMMEKISVKGDDMHLIYQFLTQKERNGVLDSEVAWNFQKYLIDEKGQLVKMIKPATSPLNEEIIHWIEN